MGKRSVKANKNIWQQAREAAALTREQAAEKMVFVSDDRIEKIESDRSLPHPDEVVAMAACYNEPGLRNAFCVEQCPIGALTQQPIPEKDFPRITLELLKELTALNGERDRLIEIASDGRVNPNEREDFARIRERLCRISQLSGSLQIWMEKTALGFAPGKDS